MAALPLTGWEPCFTDGLIMVRQFRHEQSGTGLAGFVICFTLLGIVALIGARLLPVYIENLKVSLSLQALKRDGDLINRSNDEILAFLRRNWERNQIASVTPDQIRIERTRETLKVELVYDVVRPMAGNIDTVFHFRDSFEVNG